MKKSTILSTFLAAILLFANCKSEQKKETTQKKTETSSAKFSLKNATNTIEWTAYKTTEKIPVKGNFKTVNITANGDGNSIKEAINNANFSIPVSSIDTKNSSRDFKIRKFFFGIINTELLSGKLQIETDSTGTATIKMNDISSNVNFEYTIINNVFSMKSTLDINQWNAKAAITSLNNECKELHKGADGVSKTWDEVELNITSAF